MLVRPVFVALFVTLGVLVFLVFLRLARSRRERRVGIERRRTPRKDERDRRRDPDGPLMTSRR